MNKENVEKYLWRKFKWICIGIYVNIELYSLMWLLFIECMQIYIFFAFNFFFQLAK